MISGILTRWAFDPSVVAGLLALIGVYWLYTRGPRSQQFEARHDVRFGAAIVLTVIALESPLDYLADHYLFSAHMVQHLVLLLGVALLLALCLPPALAEDVRRHVPGWAWRTATQPVLVWVLFVGDLWAWHAPPLYEAALRSETVHAGEHLSFVATAFLFWWVAFGPEGAPRLPVLARMGYIFLAGIPNTILGAVITFAPAVLYPSYQLALEQPGLGRVLAAQYGITAVADQELGGLLMWVPGGIVYLLAIISILVVWLGQQQAAEAEVA